MYDVPDPEHPGDASRNQPSRQALRGQRPSPADVDAARRCRLRHVWHDGTEIDHYVAGTGYVVAADFIGSPRPGAGPVRVDSGRIVGGRWLEFDGAQSLDWAARLRPPDERNGIDPADGDHVWRPTGVHRGEIVSSADGVRVSVVVPRHPLTPDALADLIACLAAAQDDQRCRFAVGDPEPAREDTPS